MKMTILDILENLTGLYSEIFEFGSKGLVENKELAIQKAWDFVKNSKKNEIICCC
jgi:hypothetical protein